MGGLYLNRTGVINAEKSQVQAIKSVFINQKKNKQ